MADKTINYKLTKPSGDDFYDINVHNENMDIVDAELKNLNDGKAPSGHGLGTFPKSYAGSQINLIQEVLRYGSGFYQVDRADDNPMDNSSWKPMLQLALSNESGVQLLMPYVETDGDAMIPTPQMMLRSIAQNVASDWVEMLHTGNISNYTPKVAPGTYVGTGKSGSANPNVLSFNFTPKYLYIYCPDQIDSEYYDATFLYGCPNAFVHGRRASTSSYQDGSTVTVTWETNSVSWYYANSTDNATSQLNVSGHTYYYVAIG